MKIKMAALLAGVIVLTLGASFGTAMADPYSLSMPASSYQSWTPGVVYETRNVFNARNIPGGNQALTTGITVTSVEVLHMNAANALDPATKLRLNVMDSNNVAGYVEFGFTAATSSEDYFQGTAITSAPTFQTANLSGISITGQLTSPVTASGNYAYWRINTDGFAMTGTADAPSAVPELPTGLLIPLLGVLGAGLIFIRKNFCKQKIQ